MNGWVRQSRMGLFRCDAERYVVVWQSGNGRDVIGLDGCVLVWQYGRGLVGFIKDWWVMVWQSRHGCYRLGWIWCGRKFALVWRGLVRFGHIR
jgi:hypothetical protein